MNHAPSVTFQAGLKGFFVKDVAQQRVTISWLLLYHEGLSNIPEAKYDLSSDTTCS